MMDFEDVKEDDYDNLELVPPPLFSRLAIPFEYGYGCEPFIVWFDMRLCSYFPQLPAKSSRHQSQSSTARWLCMYHPPVQFTFLKTYVNPFSSRSLSGWLTDTNREKCRLTWCSGEQHLYPISLLRNFDRLETTPPKCLNLSLR
jgi:hypothetical protein